MAAFELRPMGVGDILDTAFRLYRARFATFLTIVMIAYVPFGLVQAVIQSAIGIQQPGLFVRPRAGISAADNVVSVAAPAMQAPIGGPFDPPMPFQPQNLVLLVGSVPVLILLAFTLLPLCQGALTHNVSATYLGESIGAGESYSRAAPRLPRLLAASFLMGLAIMFGFLLCCVPGIIFAFWFSLVSPVVMLEDRGVTESLGRSRELMRGNIGKAFLLGLVVGVIAFVFSFAMGFAVRLVPWPHPFLPAFVLVLMQGLIVPITMAPSILLYYDIRIRKEAFDLQMLSNSIVGRTAA